MARSANREIEIRAHDCPQLLILSTEFLDLRPYTFPCELDRGASKTPNRCVTNKTRPSLKRSLASGKVALCARRRSGGDDFPLRQPLQCVPAWRGRQPRANSVHIGWMVSKQSARTLRGYSVVGGNMSGHVGTKLSGLQITLLLCLLAKEIGNEPLWDK